jgi:hypothetical protein
MGSVHYISSIFVGRSIDDLGPARSAGIAFALGLLIWTTAFAVWNFVVWNWVV